jgi:hypothetical protein
MKIKSALLSVALAGSMLVGGAVHAAVQQVDLTFKSGATFTGEVTFASDYSSVTAVTGTLTGYQYGTSGFVGSGSVSINWVQFPGFNYSTGAGNFSTFLLDGPESEEFNWIQFAYNYSAAPVLTFTSGASFLGFDNYVNYTDAPVQFSITPVPETSTWLMMLAGFAGLGFLGYCRNKGATVAA